MIKTIYIVNHGEKEDGPDPGHTPTGRTQIEALQKYLPEEHSDVIIGLGKRHFEMAGLLGINLDECKFSYVAGRSTSLRSGTKDEVFLANGVVIQKSQLLGLPNDAIWQFVKNLPNNSIILGGRPLASQIIKSAGNATSLPKAQMASVYKVKIQNNEISNITSYSSGRTEDAKIDNV